jgi:outer membrane autotransporter protein
LIINNEDLAIDGNVIAQDLNLDLATNQLIYSGGIAHLTGTPHIRTIYDSTRLAGGTINIMSGGQLDFSNISQLVIDLVVKPDASKIPVGTSYPLILSNNSSGNNLKLDATKVTVNTYGQPNKFTKITADGNSLILMTSKDTKKTLSSFNAPEEQAFVNTLINGMNDNTIDPNSDAGRFLNELALLTEDQQQEAVDDLLEPTTIDKAVIDNTISSIETTSLLNQVNTIIDDRFESIGDCHFRAQNNNEVVLAAGEDDNKIKYGIWVNPLYGKALHKMHKGFTGYKVKSSGAIIGGDAELTDKLLVGLAYSRINSTIKHQNKKAGDKTNSKYDIFVAYGLYNLPYYCFIEGTASHTTIKVRNYEKRLIAYNPQNIIYQPVRSNYSDKVYSGQLLLGHNFQASPHLMISPVAGVRYTHLNAHHYKERGTDFKNLAISRNAHDKWEAILGLRAASLINIGKIQLIPELQAYLNHDFKGSSAITDVKLGGYPGPLPSKQYKPFKTLVTLGSSITIRQNKFEYGVNYNANIGTKYLAHQGSLKFRVNF